MVRGAAPRHAPTHGTHDDSEGAASEPCRVSNAPGMRVYLGSGVLQSVVADFFGQKKPVGAICHGVLLAARSSFHPGKSVLYGKKTTALTKQMELIAWRLTRLYLGDYYRTYPTTVEDEVRLALARPEDFITGPLPVAGICPLIEFHSKKPCGAHHWRC